jgi:L-seryl-tRNA(Ser) seleniumtransferase
MKQPGTTALSQDARRRDTNGEPLYRMLPSVNELLLTAPFAELSARHGRSRVVEAVRRLLDRTRSEIAHATHSPASLEELLTGLPARVTEQMQSTSEFSLRRVINATGVILHTNMGRAPLSRAAVEQMNRIAAGYSNLEFDLEQGERGKRDAHVESKLLALLGRAAQSDLEPAHRAIVVNNCAAATFLALHALAPGKQVLVSRAELVEIGGGFRIPEILEESGAVLREVGTTNRTRVADYEKALSPETGLILRVHQSNFSMEGFVERPALVDLVALGRRAGVSVFEDQGTGLVESLDAHGIRGEATFAESVAGGCDLVAASGDKLLGGPQCGILAGRRELIDRIGANPLFRTFRADKLNYAALEATLVQYLCGDPESIPVIRMLRLTEDAIHRRCEEIAEALHGSGFEAGIVRVKSVIGGGTAPKSLVPSYAIALNHLRTDAAGLLRLLRRLDPPIIGRIENDRVLLDLRTVEPEFDAFLIRALNEAFETCEDPAGERH